MITNNDIAAVNLSPTKKDFYQIWSELLDTAGKISERWDPTSTNESDPGIVLLKVLTAVADKLNYNIDKNILEAFMPSAAQEESMRKLCDMMGYNIKYYQSAETTVVLSYTGENELTTTLQIPAFTALSDLDGEVNYFTTEEKYLTKELPYVEIPCIEGQIVRCETNSDNIITMNQIDDYFRYYLPETVIAENGLFVYNISDSLINARWTKVDNLNTQQNGSTVFKFCFDSRVNKPYLQFPEDLGQLIEDGLIIYYTRTHGVNGNITANTLSTFTKPTSDAWDNYASDENFIIKNNYDATNGANIESISAAYNNFKKTIGTFDTLVTCRDYLNKIYALVDDRNNPLVSNINVADIRSDINRAVNICTFNEFGICYKDYSLQKTAADGTKTDMINHFDLVLYPFKTYNNLNSKADYIGSFKYSATNKNEIEIGVNENKTLSHKFNYPSMDEIVCIKNYLKLNAKITTVAKVNAAEELSILENVKANIYTTFNMRQVDFGEEIPFDSILSCIEDADTRIKNVSLEEPVLYTKFVCADGEEYDTASSTTDTSYTGQKLYNKLALRNILGGRIELFDYNTAFATDFNEKAYPSTAYQGTYPPSGKKIVALKPSLELSLSESSGITLTPNEVIKFRAPNYKTDCIYPAYVNYYLKLADGSSRKSSTDAVAAQPDSFASIFDQTNLVALANAYPATTSSDLLTNITNLTATTFATIRESHYGLILWKNSANTYQAETSFDSSHTANYWYINNLSANNYNYFLNYIKSLTNYTAVTTGYRKLTGTYIPGHLVDTNGFKYVTCSTYSIGDLNSYAVFKTTASMGQDATSAGIAANETYTLLANEYLFINYTQSSDETSSSGKSADTVYNKTYSAGQTIKPNFNLLDSATKHTQTRRVYDMTDGYSFGQQIDGMYALGTNEQIEILEPAIVELADAGTKLYWITNNDDGDIIPTTVGTKTTYMLQDGEYLFYTDKNELNVSYFGSGTEIEFLGAWGSVKGLIHSTGDEVVSYDTIIEKGLSAIPWKTYSFHKNETVATEGRYLHLIEYQYQVLTSGDTLNTITLAEGGSALNGTWARCAGQAAQPISYTIDDTDNILPIMTRTDGKSEWEVCASLDINMSADSAQIFSSTDTSIEKLTLVYDDATTQDITPQKDASNKYIDLAIKSNYTCQSNLTEQSVKKYTYSSVVEDYVEINDFAIKLSNNTTVTPVDVGPALASGQTIDVQFNNFNSLWTKVSLSNLATVDHTETDTGRKTKTYYHYYGLPLNINVTNSNEYGIMMIYYTGTPDFTTTDYYKTTAFVTVDTNYGDLQLFNYNASSTNYGPDPSKWTWHTGKSTNMPSVIGKTGYFLRNGINILYFKQSAVLTLYPDGAGGVVDYTSAEAEDKRSVNDHAPSETVLFSNLDLVTKTTTTVASTSVNNLGININILDYKSAEQTYVDAKNPAQQLLKDLHTIDPDGQLFYYNCPISNSIAIDINTSKVNITDTETLSTARTWYDYNNINNKFVISEIDANQIQTGIRIATTSKK